MPNIQGLLGQMQDQSAKTKVTLKSAEGETVTIERTPEQGKGPSMADVIAPGSNGLMGGEVGGFSPTPISDNIPINVTGGEHVIPAPAAEKYRGLLDDITNEGRQMLARGGWVGESQMNNYAQGGEALSNKISKIYKEGYTAPGQSYAIAKSMGYFLGGPVPQVSDDVRMKIRGYAIGGQVDPAAALQQQVAGGAGGIGANPYLQRQQQLRDAAVARQQYLQDDALARQRQLEDRTYQEQLAAQEREADLQDFYKQEAYKAALDAEAEAADTGIEVDGEFEAIINGQQHQNILVGYDPKTQTRKIYEPGVGWRDLTATDQIGYKTGTGTAQQLGAADKKAVREAVQAGQAAQRLANDSIAIIDEIEAAPGHAGIVRGFERWVERLGGTQEAKALWENKLQSVALQAALANKPPGPITEKELELLLAQVPDVNANPEVKREWLYGVAIANLSEAAYQAARAKYMEANNGLDAGFNDEWTGSAEYQNLRAQLRPLEQRLQQARAAVRDEPVPGTAETDEEGIDFDFSK